MLRRIEKSEEIAIRALHESGKNWNQIAKELGFSKTAIYGARDRMGLGAARRFCFDEDRALALIEQGSPDAEVAQRLKTSIMSIQRFRWKNGIDRSQLGRRTNAEIVHFFEQINPASCYWAGVLMADGGITNPFGNYTRVLLGQCDLNADLIERFSTVVKRPIKRGVINDCRTQKKYFRQYVQIDSVHLVKTLRDVWNITPKKSFTASPPAWLIQQNDDLIFHWIRGYFDGDGGIWINDINQPRIGFSGTEDILSFIRAKLNPKSRAKIDLNKSIPTFTISGKNSVFWAGEKMWLDSQGLRLERKYERYAKWKTAVGLN